MTTLAQRILLVFSLLFLLSGCASGTRLKGLTVKLIDVAVTESGPATLTFEYYNDNLLPVAVGSSRNDLSLIGVPVKRFVADKPVGVPRLATARQEVAVDISDTDLRGKLLSAARANSAVSYSLESVLFIDAGTEELRTPSQVSGSATVTAR